MNLLKYQQLFFYHVKLNEIKAVVANRIYENSKENRDIGP